MLRGVKFELLKKNFCHEVDLSDFYRTRLTDHLPYK